MDEHQVRTAQQFGRYLRLYGDDFYKRAAQRQNSSFVSFIVGIVQKTSEQVLFVTAFVAEALKYA